MPMESKSTSSTKPATEKTSVWRHLTNATTYIQRQWYTLALVTLYIFFRPTIESKLGALFLDFNKNEDAFYCCIALGIIAVIYAILLGAKGYVLNNRIWLYFFAVLVGWYRYRFLPIENYQIAEIPIEKSIYYIDFLLVICFCILIVSGLRCLRKYLNKCRHKCLSLLCKSEQATPSPSIEGYIVDHPITAEDEDLLGRSEKAFDLAKKIFHTDTSKAAFTLGLTAPWGAGKTSFMLAMQKHLRENYRKTIILIEFNPWMYRKAPNLTQIFFEELSRALAPYSSALASGFMQYVDYILSKENNTWIQLGARLLPQGFKAKSTSEQYEFLNKEIGKLGKKIIIFIDDVDRLDSEELTELFCLVRNISSFPNMSYILAYDKEYVATQLQKKFDAHTYRYMEKIVQAEYPLAKITTEQLEVALIAVLEKLSQGYPHLKEDIQKSGIQLEQHLPTLRTIKHIYNVLLSTPQHLRERVAHFDWFVIELIRIQYPLLFDFLKTKYTQVFLVWGDRRVVMKLEGEERNALLSEDTIEGEVVDFTQYLHKNKEELGIENPNHILELMKKIWGKDRSNVIPQVNDWECIGRYFYRTMREGEFDIALLHQHLSLPFTDGEQHPMKKIIPYVDGIHKSSYWKRFCSIIHEIDLKQEQTVNMLYLYFYILSLEKVQPHFSPECDKWINSLREQDGEREKEILENLFSYPDIRKGVLLYISSILNSEEVVSIPFSSDELEEIKEKLFLEYTQDDTSIDPIDCYRLWHICQTLHSVKFGSTTGRQIAPNKSSRRMNKRMREIIVTDIEQLIPYFIQAPVSEVTAGNKGNMYRLLLPYPIWTLNPEEVTEETTYLPKFISGLDASSPIIKEIQEFSEKWFRHIQGLENYLMNPGDQASNNDLSQMDRYWIEAMLQKDPLYFQHLKNNPQEFFQIIRFRAVYELGFIHFEFKNITPQDIYKVSLAEASPRESTSIEL